MDRAGFDNDHGAYQFVAKDHIAYRYEYISPLGDGSFGQCVKVCIVVSKHIASVDSLSPARLRYSMISHELEY